jgi:drug/metabolite transporter (DMT)-like permease
MARMLVLATLWTAPFGLVGLVRSSAAPAPIAATVVLGVVGTGMAFVLMASLVGRVGGNRASFITYLIPLVALALGAAFLAESVSAVALTGAALVLAASVLGSRAER